MNCISEQRFGTLSYVSWWRFWGREYNELIRFSIKYISCLFQVAVDPNCPNFSGFIPIGKFIVLWYREHWLTPMCHLHHYNFFQILDQHQIKENIVWKYKKEYTEHTESSDLSYNVVASSPKGGRSFKVYFF